MPTKEMYMWFNKRGERVRNASGEKELARLLKNRECLVQLRMEARGISREEALKDWGTIVKVGNLPEIMKEEELEEVTKIYDKAHKSERGVDMSLTMGERIKVMLKRRNMTLAELAEKTGQSRQNLSNKMSRDNFTEKEMIVIADALNCTFKANLVMNDSGESI